MFQQKDMPHMQGTVNNQTSPANGADDEKVEVNLDEKIEVVDPTKDFNVVPPPPPAADYPIQWELAEKDGIDPRASRKVGTFLQCHFVGTILAEGTDYHGYQINEYMNSIYNKLKGTSPLHDFLNKLGHTVQAGSVSQGELKKFTEQVMAQKPVGTARIEWNTSYLDPTDKRANDKGYVTYKNKMEQFPKNPDGSYSNQIPSPVDGTTLFARAYVFSHLKK